MATQSGTTIYDATDPDLPMWMVFQGGTFRMNYSANAGTMCLAARDGLLLIGFGTSGSLGVTEIHFLLDEGRYNQANAIQKRDSWAGLANRNDAGTAWVANAPLFITGAVSQDTRGIAIHVAAEAPLDRRTGLPRPTVALATAGGRSVVLPDGRVCNSLTTAAQDWVGFDADGALYGVQNGNAGLHRIARTWYQAGGFDYDTIYYGTVPALPNPNVARAAAAVRGGVAVGGSAGVQFVCWPVGSKARGMVAYVGRTHATGWLPGDIRGCWLVNSKTADRSVKGNALTETGLLSEAAVAAGAELKGYSGFSAANYLSLAHDADLDFGDGDFAVLFWIRMSANAAAETVFERDSSPTAQRITVGVTAAGMLQFATDDGTDAVTSTGPVIDDGVWRHVACVMRGSRQELWVDGTRCDSDDATAVGSLSNPAAVLRIGLDVAGSAPLVSGALALLRVTAFAPTPDQIARIHADERPLFHENARCLLGGAVDQVDAVAADPDSGRVYFATADGTSVFEALRRVDFLDAAANANLTSGVHKAVSAVRGGYAIGSAAEAVAWLPASNLREELVASPAGVPRSPLSGPPPPMPRPPTSPSGPWPRADGSGGSRGRGPRGCRQPDRACRLRAACRLPPRHRRQRHAGRQRLGHGPSRNRGRHGLHPACGHRRPDHRRQRHRGRRQDAGLGRPSHRHGDRRMIRSIEIMDTYADGRYLRRWSIVDGRARCLDDAHPMADTDPAVRDAQLAANAAVRTAIAAVEAYEAALALAGQEEPPAHDPARADWESAVAVAAAADSATVALHLARSGEA